MNIPEDPNFVTEQLGLVMDLFAGLVIYIAKFAYGIYDFVNIFN